MSEKEDTSRQLGALVARHFEIELDAPLGEAQLLQLLADRIAWLVAHNPEYLFSLLYRNDVDESKIEAALSPAHPEPAPMALARLVLERQKQRLATRRHYTPPPIDDDELAW